MRQLSITIVLSLTALWALLGCDADAGAGPEREGDAYVIGGRGGGAAGGGMPSRDMGADDMWVSEEGPTLNSILPTRVSRAGGSEIRVIGGDFREPMEVLIGGEPCEELRVESASRMICRVPAWPSAALVDVSVAWLGESSPRLLPEALTYYDELVLSALSPAEGPTQGNTEVTLTGEGFEEPTDVRFGGLPALDVEIVDSQTIIALSPPSEARLAEVTVQNANGSSRLDQAFRWRGPLGVERISPSWGWASGGERVDLLGYGLLEGSSVTLSALDGSGGRARLTQSDAPTSLTVETPSASPGWASLELENGNGRWVAERAFLYLDPEPGSFEVLGLSPERLPSDEGGRFMIGGNGFTEATQVRLAGQEISCELLAPQRLSCFSGARAPGEVEVEVTEPSGSFTRTELLRLNFYERITLFALDPPRAATPGGALIKLSGRGLSEALELRFNDVPVEVVSAPSQEELWLRAPPHPVGLVDLSVSRSQGGVEERAFLPEALSYFDPISRYGGAWGPRIERSLNVTALDIYELRPIEGVRVEVRPFGSPNSPAQLVGLTPESGRVTLSSLDLEAPVDVTAMKADYEVVTTERVVSENLTVVMIPKEPPPEGEGMPPPAPPLARISGQLTGLSALPKPVEPGYTLLGFVDVSHSDLLNRAFMGEPSPNGILTEDGPFELEVDGGQMSVVATASYVPDWALDSFNNGQMSYWTMRRYSRPIALGLVRFLSLSPGASVEELTVNLSYETREQASVRHLNPALASEELNPAGEPIPPSYEVRAFLNLGPDGYWELDVAEESEALSVRVNDLPDMSALPEDIGLEWLGTATINEDTRTDVYHSQRDIRAEVEIGPYVGAPHIVSHGPGGMVRPGESISWELWPGVSRVVTEPAEVIFVRLIQNGFPVWSHTLPGGATELSVPLLPETEPQVGLVEGSFSVQLQAMTRYGRFDYQDFTLLDIYDPLSVTLYRHQLYFTRQPAEEP